MQPRAAEIGVHRRRDQLLDEHRGAASWCRSDSVNECDATFPRLLAGELEVAYGFAEQASRAYREQMQESFTRMNAS